jgi:hypothetical protein
MKILKLKDPSHNKLFHLDKLRKAEVIKINPNDHHVHSAPKPVLSPHTDTHPKSSKDPKSPQNPHVISAPAPNKVEPKATPQKPKDMTSLLEPAKNEKINIPQQVTPQPQPPAPIVP